MVDSRQEPGSKPVKMKAHVLQTLLRGSQSRSPSPEPLTHVQEQAALRSETINVFHTAVNGGDGEEEEEEEDLLVPREKTKDELQREEEEYAAFLRREVGEEIEELVDVGHTDVPEPEPEAEGAEGETGPSEKKKKKGKKKKPKTAKEQEDKDFLMK